MPTLSVVDLDSLWEADIGRSQDGIALVLCGMRWPRPVGALMATAPDRSV